ncbi:DUF4252 domain-containing protein [Fulvivirga sedimenti]|uniref:DUF4252 domain-containing protein n=1 Tax=Fulvivirga sedimenti TaxID=2879465 RepID=A0A9X1HN82_9BACT|nr:DUF4252 domain-containing protein [Fulvivirga sedimenti]MCA6073692.1 DUF4252 domain-containing protein [Fulvivirga sedimenti]
MKRLFLLAVAFLVQMPLLMAQSETTNQFHEDHEEAMALFFYRNSLRMLNMKDNPQLDELIRDIEKMKFLRISKSESDFDKNQYKDLVGKYHNEEFEDLMTIRSEGSNLNVFIKEKDKVTKGLVILLDNDDDFAILDIKGAVPLDRVAELMNYVRSTEDLDLNWD